MQADIPENKVRGSALKKPPEQKTRLSGKRSLSGTGVLSRAVASSQTQETTHLLQSHSRAPLFAKHRAPSDGTSPPKSALGCARRSVHLPSTVTVFFSPRCSDCLRRFENRRRAPTIWATDCGTQGWARILRGCLGSPTHIPGGPSGDCCGRAPGDDPQRRHRARRARGERHRVERAWRARRWPVSSELFRVCQGRQLANCEEVECEYFSLSKGI